MEKANWPTAYEWAKQAYAFDTSNFEATILLAVCANEIKEFEESAHLFEQVSEKDLGKLEPDALYYLAHAKKEMGKYEEAEVIFRKYVKKSKSNNQVLKKKAEQEIKNCIWAKQYESQKDSLNFYHLPTSFQHPKADIMPRLMDSTLAYYFNDGTGQAVWKRRLVNLDGSQVRVEDKPDLLGRTEFDNMAIGTIQEKGEVNLIMEVKKGSLWDRVDIKNEMYEVQGETYVGQPFLTKIEGVEYLFFVSDRAGGEGGKDIWISRMQKGKWSKPFNAGKKVNTPDDELSPFYVDGQLYFSGSWYEGFGGWDVYVSKGKPGSFAKPTNMGKPINSNFNDWGFSIYTERHIGFLSSDRPLNDSTSFPPCCTDLYAFTWEVEEEEPKKTEVDSLMARVESVNYSLPIKLYFHNDEPNPNTLDTLTQFTYQETYEKYLKLAETYKTKLHEQEKKNAFIDEEVDAFFENEVTQGVQDLETFERIITPELEQGNQVVITVRGFASPRAASDYNRRISLRRISSIKNRWENMPVWKNALDCGQLVLVGLPFGETKAKADVSDELGNEKKSIYSRGARLERRIEIESVSITKKETSAVRCLTFNESLHYFGRVQKGSTNKTTFQLKNCGTEVLHIDSVNTSCGCTVPALSVYEIAPGQSIPLDITYQAPTHSSGKQIRWITIYLKGLPEEVLTIEAIVD